MYKYVVLSLARSTDRRCFSIVVVFGLLYLHNRWTHISGTDYVSNIYYRYEFQLLLHAMFDCTGGWYLVGSIKRSCLAPFISNSSHLPRLNCINTHISTASLNTIICSLRLRGQNIPIALFKVTLRNTDTTMMHDATLPTANCSVGQDAGFVKSKLCKLLSCGWLGFK